MGNFTAAQRELWRGRLFASADVTERERDVIKPWIGVHSRRQREEIKKYETYFDKNYQKVVFSSHKKFSNYHNGIKTQLSTIQ